MRLLSILSLAAVPVMGLAQSVLYPQHFDLDEVTLLESPFKTAMETNDKLLLEYDADRLMTPFVRQAGLSETSDEGSRYYKWLEKHPSFENWGLSDWSLEGHVGGHYLTALALAYASTRDAEMKKRIKERLDYCLDIVKDCQDAYAENKEGLRGFVGGQPLNNIWTELYAGRTDAFDGRGWWVPLYCQHKVLAGLRDAYVYAGSEKAKEMYRGMCDWSVDLFGKLTKEQRQHILRWEHGGMNETLADAYKIFGEKKYLDAAKAYSHEYEIDGMQGDEGKYNRAFLSGQHANTQVPKFIGFERINQLEADKTYYVAARNFWDDVATNRTVCIGGNSIDEHFLAEDRSSAYISNSNGPESCNSNNMLKLSEMMFDQTHDAKYVDFYEATMINHILSTQDPKTGGYVYFTSLRPQSYRIYSTVNESMWCCVGTGMENHSKYGHFIYTHSNDKKSDTLFVNLFVPSELNSGKFVVKQETNFPYGNKVRITIGKDGKYNIAVRHPAWTTKDYAVYRYGMQDVKNKEQVVGKASYIVVGSKWKKGDVIEINLPMELRYEECPGLSDYVAFKYGPVLLGARTSEVGEALQNEYGHEGRMDHAPGSMANALDVTTSPLLIGERSELLRRIKATDLSKLQFVIDASSTQSKGKWKTLTLEPFYGIHHSRYMCYWYQQTKAGYEASDMAKVEAVAVELNLRTIDYVGTGEQQSEAGHNVASSKGSTTGSYNGEFYRDAQANGFIQYTLSNNNGIKGLSIMCRFTAADSGRMGSITIEGKKVADIKIERPGTGLDANGFYNVEYSIPDDLITNEDGSIKKEIVFRMDASGTTVCPGLYFIRLLSGK